MKLSFIRNNKTYFFTEKEVEYITYVSQKYEWVGLIRKTGDVFSVSISKMKVHNVETDVEYPLIVSESE